MKFSVLIDASNLRAGGGVQVAASFLDELSDLVDSPTARSAYPWLTDIKVEASPEVLANISELSRRRLGVVSRLRRPLDLGNWIHKPTHDVAFTIFGPVYGRRRGRRQITGFADVTSVFPSPPGIHLHRGVRRPLAPVRRRASMAAFQRADRIIVEASHVRDALVSKWDVPTSRIDVVPNCVNGNFRSSVAPARERSGWAYVTRAYPHKNIDFLGNVGRELYRRGVSDLRFVLTLTDDEWRSLDESTRFFSVNVGPLSVHELPAFYARREGAVFPSLLECFSVTPLEALATGNPLVASDRPFVRDVCGSAALYADPYDPVAWADALIRLRKDPLLRESLVSRGQRLAAASYTPRMRAEKYLKIIDGELQVL